MGVKVKVSYKDLGWREFFKRASSIQKRLRVGVLSSSTEGGLHIAGADLSVAEIAAVNEFGTEDGHIPERSFIRSTFDEEREKIGQMVEKLLSQVLAGKMNVDQVINVLGAYLASAIKKKIVAHVPPPNAPSTIKQKGSATPLVDTGRLLGAITWAIIDAEGESE